VDGRGAVGLEVAAGKEPLERRRSELSPQPLPRRGALLDDPTEQVEIVKQTAITTFHWGSFPPLMSTRKEARLHGKPPQCSEDHSFEGQAGHTGAGVRSRRFRLALGPRRACLAAVIVAVCAWAAAGSGATAHIVLDVSPGNALVDQPVAIMLSGLRSDSTVTLNATTRDAQGRTWKSTAAFRAGRRGIVSPGGDRAIAGSYRGVDPMGLFWSMAEVGSTTPRNEQTLDLPIVSTVKFAAVVAGKTVATTSLTRRSRNANVTLRRTTIADDGFLGCYWAPPPSGTRMPAVLEFGGSEGGLACDGGLLASHGYPVLDLAYFGAPGLPQKLERVPLEYFEKALRWLAQQPGVDPDRLVAWGISRGGEAAFLLGTTYPKLVHAVVDYVGSSVVYASPDDGAIPAWTLHGKPIPSGTQIPVERVAGPLFMVGGWDDELFASGARVESVATQLRAHHRKDFTALTYENAGHSIGAAIPNLPIGWAYFHLGVPHPLGGTLVGNARAREDSWPKLLAFLARLGG
jgi:dienelactone hydrolase